MKFKNLAKIVLAGAIELSIFTGIVAAPVHTTVNAKTLNTVKLVKATDGDTATFKYKGKNIKVRFLLIDTPESVKPNTTKKSSSNTSSKKKTTKTYKNCTELRKDYPNGVKKGHKAYQAKMDRDKDGWACER